MDGLMRHTLQSTSEKRLALSENSGKIVNEKMRNATKAKTTKVFIHSLLRLT